MRASSVGLLVPAGLLLALAVAATIGGAGDLRGVDQLFRGPRMPPAAQQALAAADRTPLEAGVPLIPEASRDAVTLRRAGTSRSIARRQRRARAPRRDAGRRSPSRRRPARTPSPDAPPQRRPPGQQPPPQPPPPPERPRPIREVGGVVTQTVRPVPVVGEPAADVVQTVVDLVDPPERAPAAPAPGVAEALGG